MRRVDHHSGAILLGSFLLLLSVAGLLGAGRISLPPASPAARLLGGGGQGGQSNAVAYTAPATPTAAVLRSPTPFQPDMSTIPPIPTAVAEAAAAASSGVDTANSATANQVGADIADGSDINDSTAIPGGEEGDGSFLVPHSAEDTPTPPPEPLVPERIVIPAVGLDALVLASNYQLVNYGGQLFQQWDAPTQYAAGWQTSSAMLGVPGNTVLNGHHNVYGSVFGRLFELNEGDLIQIYSGGTRSDYSVSNKMILEEQGMPLSTRMDNARWLQASQDERLTLVTCWPEWTNTHRLIIVARPIARSAPGE